MSGELVDITHSYGPVTERVAIGGSDHEALFMDDGKIRFAHDCKDVLDGLILRSAPTLQMGRGHEIVTRDPLTIVASVLCDDCGLHGWVTGGQWVQA